MTPAILKSFASAMDRDIERKRMMAEHHARVVKFTQENEKFFNSEKCQQQLHPGHECLEWDSERAGPQISDTQWDHDLGSAEHSNQIEIKQTP